jgi:hypothetical protein
MNSNRLISSMAILIFILLLTGAVQGQQDNAAQSKPDAGYALSSTSESGATSKAFEAGERERLLLERIDKLERRLSELESRAPAGTAGAILPGIRNKPEVVAESSRTDAQARATGEPPATDQISSEDRGVLDFLRDTTFNITLDGYYGYNFNKPIGRINLLRAYDVMSNSFSLNQAAVVIERAPNLEVGRRFGVRLDLQYGQATETLQGSAANELRPQAYRPVFQAYGTYVAPVGSGLTVDFGKWASAFGIENNYTKDQMNYSRSYYFNFLPFYHLGVRASYSVNEKLNVSYWLVNGIQQSEDFNGFKSQAALLNIKPAKTVSWNINYYIGIEGRDEIPALNPGLPALPAQPGLPREIIRPVPHGRTHIFDTYVAWNATAKLTLAAEGDYFVSRQTRASAPSRVAGGAAYVRRQFTPKFALAVRVEYLSDRGGLFSGVTQALKETTATADYKLADGFLVRGEWRRDFSNRRFFLTDTPGLLERDQNTATLGLIWWIGRKQGAW